MELEFIGSGCITPQSDRLPSSYLLKDYNFNALVDIGPGIYQALKFRMTNPFDVDCIFISHFHPDHLADLWPFLFGRHYSQQYFPIKKQLIIVAEKSFNSIWKNQMVCGNIWLEKIENVELVLLNQNDVYENKQFRVKTFPMVHQKESLGYAITAGDKTVSFSGDTGYTPALFDLISLSDVSILECSFDNSVETDYHLNPLKVEKILQASGQNQKSRIYLSHFYPGVTASIDFKNLLEKYNRIKASYDGLKITI